MSPSQIIALYLIATGDPRWLGIAIFYGSMPNTPDAAVCVYDTTGVTEGRIQKTGQTIEHPGIQIRVRDKTYAAGHARAAALAERLDTTRRVLVTAEGQTYRIESATRTTTVIALGEEPGTKRFIFTVNAILTISKV